MTSHVDHCISYPEKKGLKKCENQMTIHINTATEVRDGSMQLSLEVGCYPRTLPLACIGDNLNHSKIPVICYLWLTVMAKS